MQILSGESTKSTEKSIAYTDDLSITVDIFTDDTFLLHHLVNDSNVSGFYVSVSKSEFISFNQ